MSLLNKGILVKPAEAYRVWFDLKAKKVYMTNIKTGKRVVPDGITMS